MSGPPSQVEQLSPFDLAGGSVATANALNATALGGGQHTVTAQVTLIDGSTVTLLTTAANPTIAPIHDRMPVVIDPGDFGRWLDHNAHGPDEVADLVHPAPADLLEAIPVSPRVNAARNDDPGLLEPIAAAGR